MNRLISPNHQARNVGDISSDAARSIGGRRIFAADDQMPHDETLLIEWQADAISLQHRRAFRASDSTNFLPCVRRAWI
jgi:hypothetical protein